MARPWQEMFQVLWTTLLNVAGVDVQPREVRGYRLSNSLQRSLAHLAAQDGKDSRLLLCDSSGRLYTVAVGADGVAPAYSATGRLGVVVRDEVVDGRSALVSVYGDLSVRVGDSSTYAACGEASSAGAFDNALSVRNSKLNDLFEVLSDCHDATNHCLAVKVITP